MAARLPSSPTLPTTGMETSSSMNFAQTSSSDCETGQEQLLCSVLRLLRRPPTIWESLLLLTDPFQLEKITNHGD